MKFNFDNFLGASHTGIKKMHVIKEGSNMVRTEPMSGFNLIGYQYHSVRWWAIIYRNNQQELLVFLKNPKSKWSCEEWSDNYKFFKEALNILRGECQ